MANAIQDIAETVSWLSITIRRHPPWLNSRILSNICWSRRGQVSRFVSRSKALSKIRPTTSLYLAAKHEFDSDPASDHVAQNKDLRLLVIASRSSGGPLYFRPRRVDLITTVHGLFRKASPRPSSVDRFVAPPRSDRTEVFMSLFCESFSPAPLFPWFLP